MVTLQCITYLNVHSCSGVGGVPGHACLAYTEQYS
jgi:hypothetical protein